MHSYTARSAALKKINDQPLCIPSLSATTLTDSPAGVDGGHLGGSPESRETAARLLGVPAVTATAALAAGDGEALFLPFNGDDEEAFLLGEDSGAFLSNGDDGAFLFNGDCEAAFFSGDDGGGWVFVEGRVEVSSLEMSAKRKLPTSSTPSTCTLYHPTFLLTTVPVGPGKVGG